MVGFDIRATITLRIEVFICRVSINWSWLFVFELIFFFFFPIDLRVRELLIKTEPPVETRFKSVCVGSNHMEGSGTTGEEEISNRASIESGSTVP